MSDIPRMPYAVLWEERELISVANLTRHDAEEFFPVAARAGVRAHTTPYPLDQANKALADLRAGRLSGAAVLVPQRRSPGMRVEFAHPVEPFGALCIADRRASSHPGRASRTRCCPDSRNSTMTGKWLSSRKPAYLGIAQLSANDDHGTAEYAFLVRTDLQNGCTLLACLPVMPPLQ